MMLSTLRGALQRRQAERPPSCRRTGHTWTEMAHPVACATCGRTRPVEPERAAA